MCERCRFVKLLRQPPDAPGHPSRAEIQVSGVHQAEVLSVPEGIANNTKLSVAVVLLQGPELDVQPGVGIPSLVLGSLIHIIWA